MHYPFACSLQAHSNVLRVISIPIVDSFFQTNPSIPSSWISYFTVYFLISFPAIFTWGDKGQAFKDFNARLFAWMKSTVSIDTSSIGSGKIGSRGFLLTSGESGTVLSLLKIFQVFSYSSILLRSTAEWVI